MELGNLVPNIFIWSWSIGIGQATAHNKKWEEGTENASVDEKIVGIGGGQGQNGAETEVERPTPFNEGKTGILKKIGYDWIM